MSLFDTFDPHSEEVIKANLQRSYREEENFPEVIIGAFKEETFHVLDQVCRAEEICTLREGRTIPGTGSTGRGGTLGFFILFWAEPGLCA